MQETSAVDVCLEDHLSIVRRVVGREMARGLMPWVDRSDLEDVAQLALVEALAKYKGECAFGAFAYRVVRSAVLDELKKLKVRNSGRAEMPEDVDHQPISGPGIELFSALSALPPRQYRVVMLVFWGRMTLSAVAEEMGVSCERVSQILGDAKKNLKGALENLRSQSHIQVTGEKGQAA